MASYLKYLLNSTNLSICHYIQTVMSMSISIFFQTFWDIFTYNLNFVLARDVKENIVEEMFKENIKRKTLRC